MRTCAHAHGQGQVRAGLWIRIAMEGACRPRAHMVGMAVLAYHASTKQHHLDCCAACNLAVLATNSSDEGPFHYEKPPCQGNATTPGYTSFAMQCSISDRKHCEEAVSLCSIL